MRATIAEVEELMNKVLGKVAEIRARERGFTQRRSKLNGASFAQTLVYGWLHNPNASLEALAQTAASLGVEVSPQALDQRFSAEAAAYLKDVLDASVSELVSSESVAIAILERFSAVVVQDSSVVKLPDELEELWSGVGGSDGKKGSSVKLHVKIDLKGGGLEGLRLTDGRIHDQTRSSRTTA